MTELLLDQTAEKTKVVVECAYQWPGKERGNRIEYWKIDPSTHSIKRKFIKCKDNKIAKKLQKFRCMRRERCGNSYILHTLRNEVVDSAEGIWYYSPPIEATAYDFFDKLLGKSIECCNKGYIIGNFTLQNADSYVRIDNISAETIETLQKDRVCFVPTESEINLMSAQDTPFNRGYTIGEP